MRVVRRCLTLLAALALAGCASTGQTAAASGGNRSLLTAEELRAEPGTRTLDEIIRQRRPTWLTSRGATSLQGGDEIVVYRDGVPTGGPATLRSISAETVESVQFLSAADATTRFGTGHSLGAILVVTRRR